jgi:truncated hemoglobin YjbI
MVAVEIRLWYSLGHMEVEDMEPSEKRVLYDRLGGVYSIATVVDDFIDRVMSDTRLNANPLVDDAAGAHKNTLANRWRTLIHT